MECGEVMAGETGHLAPRVSSSVRVSDVAWFYVRCEQTGSTETTGVAYVVNAYSDARRLLAEARDGQPVLYLVLEQRGRRRMSFRRVVATREVRDTSLLLLELEDEQAVLLDLSRDDETVEACLEIEAPLYVAQGDGH